MNIEQCQKAAGELQAKIAAVRRLQARAAVVENYHRAQGDMLSMHEADIYLRIAKLSAARKVEMAIQDAASASQPMPTAPAPAPDKAPEVPRAKETPASTPKGRTATSRHYVEVARSLPAKAWTIKAFQEKCGGDPARAEVAVFRMARNGILIRHGAGIYSMKEVIP